MPLDNNFKSDSSPVRANSPYTSASTVEARGGQLESMSTSDSSLKGYYMWRQAVGLAMQWGRKVENPSESVYTMAMDVCEQAGKNKGDYQPFSHHAFEEN